MHKDRFVYARKLGDRAYVVDCNLGAKSCRAFPVKGKGELVYDTVRTGKRAVKALEGYEARIWRIDRHCTAKGGL